MKKILIVSAMSIALTACASNPDKIQAAYVSPLKYQGYDCEQLGEEMGYIGQRTNKLYHSLKKKRKGDNWQMGVGLLLFWPTLFALEGGDGPEATEYAQLMGEFEAARTTAVQKNCNIAAASPTEIMEGKAEVETTEAEASGADSETGEAAATGDELEMAGAASVDDAKDAADGVGEMIADVEDAVDAAAESEMQSEAESEAASGNE
jgi:hypothetical protein